MFSSTPMDSACNLASQDQAQSRQRRCHGHCHYLNMPEQHSASFFSASHHHRSWCERQAPIRQSIPAPMKVKAEKDIRPVDSLEPDSKSSTLAADVVHGDPEADSSVVLVCQLEDVLRISAKRKQQQLAEEPSNMFSAPWLLCGILLPKVLFQEGQKLLEHRPAKLSKDMSAQYSRFASWTSCVASCLEQGLPNLFRHISQAG